MTMQNQVGGFSTEIDVTPVVSLVAYTAGDQLGGIQTLAYLDQRSLPTDAACQDKTVSFLASLVLIDAAAQNAPCTIYFFNALPTVASSDNAALSITAAELKAKCVGFVEVLGTDWKTVGTTGIAALNFPKCGLALKSNTDDGPLYAVVQVDGTPTYVAVGDLSFKYIFSQDLGNGRNK